MPANKKGSGKSSASSATRKKQAAKKAKKAGDGPDAVAPGTPKGPQRGQKKDKKSKKEPKKKVFIPPPKPPQPPPDPLDTLGLASLLPPGLVVLLRKAAKKDVVTRSRALEGLLAWVDGQGGEDEEAKVLSAEERESALVMMLPSWAHLFPRLAASPTRRLRLLTAQIHSRLLAPSLSTRGELTQSHQYIEPILGPWATLAWDTDRATSLTARESWEKAVTWGSDVEGEEDKLPLSDYLSQLANYLSLLLSQGSSAALTSASAAPALTRGQSFANGAEGGRDAKNRDETNVEEDPRGIDARLAAGALGVLTWIFSSNASVSESCEELVNLLHSQEMWGALHSSPQHEGLGAGYPVTRTRAWELIEVLTAKHDGLLTQTLDIVAPIALSAAWEERDASTQRQMLDALLPLLSKHPDAWKMAGEQADSDGDDDDDDDEDDEDSEEEAEAGVKEPKIVASTTSTLSTKLASFTAWVQSGCAGQPLQGLPTILIFLTTIHADLFPLEATPWDHFLNNFWASYKSGLYDSGDRLPLNVFFNSYVECSAYLVGRVSKNSTEQAAQLARDHLGKVWREEVLDATEGREPIETRRTNPAAVTRLNSLRQGVDDRLASTIASLDKLNAATPLLDAIFGRLDEIAQGSIARSAAHIERAVSILSKLASSPSEGSTSILAQQVQSRVTKAADEAAQATTTTSLDSRLLLLSSLLSHFPADLGPSSAARSVAQDVLPTSIAQQSISTPTLGNFISAYARAAPSLDVQKAVVTLVESAASVSDPKAKVATLQCLLDGLPSDVQLDAPSGTKLDDVALDVANELASGSKTEGEAFLSRILDQPGPLVDVETVKQILAILISHIHGAAREQRGSAESSLDQIAGILHHWVQKAPQQRLDQVRDIHLLEPLLTAAFMLKYLRQSGPHGSLSSLWDAVSSDAKATDAALEVLRDSVLDAQIEVVIVLEAARRFLGSSSTVGSSSKEVTALSILPSRQKMDEVLLEGLAATSSSPALAILDPLVTPKAGKSAAATSVQHDVEGLSPSVRSAYALLLTLEESRATAKANPWALPHLVFLATVCEDELNAAGSSGGLVDGSVDPARLQGILVRAVQVSSGILVSVGGSTAESWHKTATEALQRGLDGAVSSQDALLATLARLWQQCLIPSSDSRLPRIFSRLISGVLSFSSAGDQEATLWLRLGMSVESKAPLLSEAVILSSKPLVLETPFYDRMRNDVVSRLSATPPTKAASEGVRLLRLAVALAPPVESDVALVPQQRALFLLQGLQRWMASEEDFPDEVNTLMVDLFLHVAPIVQEMPGTHLDFFYDVLEENLEVASLKEEASLPGLHATLQLLETLCELAGTNATLREVHKDHEEAIVELLQPLFASLATMSSAKGQQQAARTSLPLELTSDLLVSVVRRNSEGKSGKAFGQSTEHRVTLCKLLSSPMRSVQATAYRMLSASIRAHVQELIFQSAMDKGNEGGGGAEGAKEGDGGREATEVADEAQQLTTSKPTPVQKHRVELLPQLIEAVRSPLVATVEDLQEDADLCRATLSYLLCWLAIFEHFEGATPALRAVFSSQLQSDGALVGSSLMPTVFDLVEPQRSGRTQSTTAAISASAQAASAPVAAYDPERFCLDELFLDSIDPSDVTSLRHLAAHVYLRSLIHLASSVREWFSSIKDRQLSIGVASFTTRHCSPLLTGRELSALRDPDSEARQQLLQDDAMSIKVLSSGTGGGGEVLATYTIDEHPLEMAIRLPSSYPLHPIEVKDVRRVGVAESTWRSWLLSVQRLVSTEGGGLVVDALLLFKRNAEAKFAGYEGAECAICYSIISPEDKRSLPNKHCKTCKHGFHAACLFRWVSTSGSATCPLCRSTL